MLPPQGSAFSRYTFGRELGRGGMGIVYEAVDARLGRTVALKILREGHGSSEGKRRFLQEAQAASALNHPGIVTIHDMESADNVDFIVMEYVDGTPLSRLIGPDGLPLVQVLDYADQTAGALAAAHAAGIVHRDLKPANIMVTRDGRIKVLDFGLSKLPRPEPLGNSEMTRSLAPETMPGVVMGTGGYMSPEQASGEAVDARTDVFSFGIVLYEMLTGARPFAGDSHRSMLRAVLQDQPRTLHDVRSDVPPEVERIVARCLEKEPANRYSSAVEIHRDLGNLALSGSTASERSLVTRRHFRIAGAAALVVLTIAVLGVWTFVRRAQAETERKAAVAEVEHLVDVGRFVEVWRVVKAAAYRWPDDPQFAQALRATTDIVTIATDPPGAEVAFKAYEDVDGEWLSLGTSPLEEVRAPLGQLRWRITKDGFEPLEARLEVGAPAAAAGRTDVAARPIPLRPVGSDVARMVFVPGGRRGGVQLTDYWIDQTEVTNREFKEFIDQGGYQDQQYWTHLRRESPQLLARDRAAVALRDRTGRPGPSTWELGTYPEGQGDYPVSGVSWFEAGAYCQSAGKSLPTVFHWRNAFGASFFSEVVMLGNFNGRGPEALGRLKEVGPYGTYGMAGNVKEWVWNELEGRRHILGGAWNEPVYMAIHDDVRPSLDRAETHGFRCVKESAPSEAAAYAAVGAGSRARDVTKEKPVDAAAFEIFRRFYSYDRTPLNPIVERTEEAEHWRRERVSFAAAYGGERVLANILLPRNAAPPYQAVIWFPGSYARGLKFSDRDLVFSYYFDFLPRSGRALVYPVYKGTYERPAPPGAGTSQQRDLVVQWSKDLGRTIDYLESRSDFDRDKLAYYGFSMGADEAVPIVALEPRLKTAIFLAGGLNSRVRPPEVEPLHFLPRIEVPVLLLGGGNDFIRPVETSQAPLFKLLGTPPEHKRHVVFQGAGHVPPRIELIRVILDWLDRYLGPVRR
ncbi:MAG: protein kinase domain-containing protein [Acidobacteriota bacterium]